MPSSSSNTNYRTTQEKADKEIYDFIHMIKNISDLKIVYTVLAQSFRSGFLTKEKHSKYIDDAIVYTIGSCNIEKDELNYVLKKAEQDGLITSTTKEIYGNGLVHNMNSRLTKIENEVNRLNIKADNIESCMKGLRQEHNKNLKAKSYINLASSILNLFTLGIAGNAMSAIMETTLCQIVDFSDLNHIKDLVQSSDSINSVTTGDISLGDALNDGMEYVEENYDKKFDDNMASILNKHYDGQIERGRHSQVGRPVINDYVYRIGVTLQISAVDSAIAQLEKPNSTSSDAYNEENEDKYIETVIHKMNQHNRVVAIQKKGCMALASLAAAASLGTCNEYHDNKQTIAIKQGTKTIINGMNAHRDNIDVQTFGCMALMNLGMTSSFKRGRDDYNDNDGGDDRVITVLRSISIHNDVAAVVQYGCGALMNLTSDPFFVMNKKIIADNNGIQTIFDAMGAYPKKSDIQYYGCGILCNLLSLPENEEYFDDLFFDIYHQNRETIKRCIDFDLIFDASANFPNEKNIQEIVKDIWDNIHKE